jgi:hypothetical protein
VQSRTDANDLVKLADEADEIVAEHEAATQDNPRHEWPSWRAVWSEIIRTKRKRHWLTPPHVYQKLDEAFPFDYDPCQSPRPEGFNSFLVPWVKSNFVSPPQHDDVVGGRGPTAFVKERD